MAATGKDPVVPYNNQTNSNPPSAGNLARGELAINLPDRKIYTKDHTDTVVELSVATDTYDHLLAANDTVNTAISTDITNGDIAFGDVIYVGSHYISTEYAGVPKGGAHYIYTSGAADASGSEISTNSNHLKLIEPIITPFHFGVVEDATDEKAKVQKFFDYVTTNTEVHCDWSCNVTVGTGLVWDGTNDYKVDGYLRITAETDSAIAIVLTIKNAIEQSFGGIWCYGDYGSTYSTRTSVDLVYLENCRLAKFDHIHVRKARRYGLLIDSSITGNNNYIHINVFQANDCGTGESGVRLVTETISGTPTRQDTSGSPNQYTVITTTNALPAELETDDSYVVVDGSLYRVMAFDGGLKTINVYPWTDDTQAQASLTYCIGAAVKTKGGDSGGLHIDICEVVGSAIGHNGSALYGTIMGECSTQNCIVGQLYGQTENGAHIGTNVQRSYFEANTFDLIQATRTRIYVRLVNNVNMTLSKCHNISAMRYTGALGQNHLYIPFRGLDASLDRTLDDENYAPPQNSSIGNNAGSSSFAITQGQTRENYRDTATVTLTDDPDFARLTGVTTATLIINGTGTDGQATGTYTIAVEGGYTIDGGSTKTYTGMLQPLKVQFKLIETEWYTVTEAPEGTAVRSTGETGGTKYLREDGDGTSSWQPVTASVAALNDITNVTITANSSGEILKWNGSAWVNNTLAEAGIEPADGTILKDADIGSTVQAYNAALTGTTGTYTTANATTLSTALQVNPALGTPVSGVATNLTGTATGLTSGITNALKSATTTVDVSAATAPTTGQVLKATSSTAATWQNESGGGGNEFADNVFRIQDDGDATKEIAFQASGITTATTRTVTMPDANVDLGALMTASSAATLTNKTFDANATGNVLSNVDLANDVTGELPTANIANDAVNYAKLQNAAANSFLGNNTGSAADTIAMTAAQAKTVLAIVPSDITTTVQTAKTGGYTGVLGDAGQMVRMSHATGSTFTIPAESSVNYAVGTQIHIMQVGAGVTTIAITTDTLDVNANLQKKTNGQWAVCTVMKTESAKWVVFGNLLAA